MGKACPGRQSLHRVSRRIAQDAGHTHRLWPVCAANRPKPGNPASAAAPPDEGGLSAGSPTASPAQRHGRACPGHPRLATLLRQMRRTSSCKVPRVSASNEPASKRRASARPASRQECERLVHQHDRGLVSTARGQCRRAASCRRRVRPGACARCR
jgi:hypothetical protein